MLARQPGVAARARAHLIASPFGTIHAAMFGLPRPIGTAIRAADLCARQFRSLRHYRLDRLAAARRPGRGPLQFPSVNRKGKGNSLIVRRRAPLPPLPPLLPVAPMTAGEADATLKNDVPQSRFDPYAEYEFAVPDTAGAPDVELPTRTCRPRASPRWRRPKRPGFFARLLRRRSAHAAARAHRALGAGRGAGSGKLRRSRHQAIGAHQFRRRGHARRIGRRQRRGDRRRRAAEIAGRAAGA